MSDPEKQEIMSLGDVGDCRRRPYWAILLKSGAHPMSNLVVASRSLMGFAFLALTLLLAGCAKEPDERWRQVARNVYLDPTSIKMRAGYKSAWFDFRKTPSAIFFWSSPKHSLSLEAIDCDEERMATMASRDLRNGYYESDEDAQKLQFEYVTPGTVAEAMLDAVCIDQPRGNSLAADSH